MEHRLWINGEWTASQEGGTIAIENPASGDKKGISMSRRSSLARLRVPEIIQNHQARNDR